MRGSCVLGERLHLVDVDVAGELHGGEVHDADRVAGVDDVEADAEAVQLSVVREDLVGLLRVVRGVQNLDAGVQLPAVRVQDNLELLCGRIDREGAERSTVHADAIGGGDDFLGKLGHGTLGVVRRGADRELVLTDVLDLDHGLLVAGADERLDRAQVTVLAVRLELHRRPVRAEPELHIGVHGAARACERELDAVPGDVVELPGLARLALDPLRKLAVRRDVLHSPATDLKVHFAQILTAQNRRCLDPPNDT